MIRAGRHLVRVEVPGKGHSQNTWWGVIGIGVWGATPGTVSAGGALVMFTGIGMDTEPN